MKDSAARAFRFAIQGGPFEDGDALREHATQVEGLGYDELFTSDHVGAPGSGGGKGAMYVVDPFLPLIAAAEATTRLRLGPLVLNNEFYNPALLARTVATADRLTGGRVVLGLGTGYSEAEHDGIGSAIRPPGARVSRFAESLHVLRSLLDTGSVSHDGAHVSARFDDFGIGPTQQHVPFLIGGHGRRVVGLAGRFADIFQFTGLTHGDGGAPMAGGFALSELVVRARWLSEAAGSRDSDIERSALVQFTAVGAEAPSASVLAERFEVAAEVIEETPFVLSGSVDQIVDKIERLRTTVGISHYVVRDPAGFAPVVRALVDG